MVSNETQVTILLFEAMTSFLKVENVETANPAIRRALNALHK